MLQIVEGEKFIRYAEATENVVAKTNTPRGVIKDKKGNIIVDNDPVYNLVYTRQPNVSGESLLETAKLLAQIIDKETDKVTERDKKDYYIVSRGQKELIEKKISKKEQEEVGEDGLYKLLLDKITEKDLAEISKEEMEVAAIWREMNTGYSLSEQVIKEDITKEEFAVINEHLAQLQGVDVQVAGERVYPYGDTLRTLLGGTGKIPKEKRDYYAARGYDLNDEVGKSGIELQYEDVLSGIKEKKKYLTSRTGSVIDDPEIIPGQSGKELVLTVDMDLQKKVEKILESEIRKVGSARSAYAVVVNPKTGEILSLAGKAVKDGKMQDDLSSTYLQSFMPGSSIKGATVLAGFMHGVMKPGEYVYDRPLNFKGGGRISSVGGARGPVNDITSLEISSNIYMSYVGMRLAGYGFDCSCWTGDKKGEAAFNDAIQKFRESFHQFGLGVETGIDLPHEETGFKGKNPQLGNVAHYGFGQYDTFTPLQLAQYVSTVANDGKRMKLHLVKEVREASTDGETGKLVKRFEPELLNHVNANQNHFDRVQQGMYRVTKGSRGTARAFYKGLPVAGKTGTAEVGKKGSGLENLMFVGYAPYDDPEIAFSVVVPNVRGKGNGINNLIGQGIAKAYFDMKDKPHTLNTNGDESESDSES